MFEKVASDIQGILQVVTTPLGIFALILGLIAIAGFVLTSRGKWVAVTAAFYIVTLYRTENEWFDITFSAPLSYLSTYSRYIYMGILGALVLINLKTDKGWRSKPVSVIAYAFLAFQLLYVTRLVLSPWVGKGLLSFVIYIMTFISFGMCLSKMLQSIDDVQRLLKCVLVGFVLVILGTCFQLVVKKSAVVPSGRMFATTMNPQSAAILFAYAILIISYLLMDKGVAKRKRIAMFVLLGCALVFLLWTGSRTGVALAVIGLLVLFRSHFRKFAVYVFAAGFLFMFGMFFFGDQIGDSVSRLGTTENTRLEPWLRTLDNYMQFPLFGTMQEDQLLGESAYLSALAGMGTIGGLFMLVLVGCICKTVLKLMQYRKLAPETTFLIDFIVAGLLMFLAAGIMEAVFFGVFAFPILLLYMFMAMSKFVTDAVEYNLANQHQY